MKKLFGLVLIVLSLFGFSNPAFAQDSSQSQIDVIELQGYLDPINADFLQKTIHNAQSEPTEVIVVQLNSPGVLIPDETFDELKQQVLNSKAPVAVWIGDEKPKGKIAELLTVVDAVGTDPTLGDFIVGLDGRNLSTQIVETAQVVRDSNGVLRQEPTKQISFHKTGIFHQLLHTAASPSVAYIFFVAGCLLILFEFFSVGIGIASASGTLLVALSAYGFGVLPLRLSSLLLLLFAMFGFAIDAQVGVSRAWSAIGAVSFLFGTLFLYDGISLSIFLVVIMTFLTLVFVLGAIPTTIRARFSTRTIGREWMIGEVGNAKSSIHPEGIVEVRGGLWKARSTRAAKIEDGETVTVTAIQGQILEVEPNSR